MPVKVVIMALEARGPPELAVIEQPSGTEGGTTTQPKPPPAKAEPISIFISRKQEKLFVRQGFTTLFESAVMIRNPERALGTHVFTAIERMENSEAMRWTVVSFPDESSTRSGRIRNEAKQARFPEREARRSRFSAQPRPSAERANAA